MFSAYQPLPALLTAALVALTRDSIPAACVLADVIVALWMVVPVAWFWGGRAFGLDRLTSLALGILALAPRDFTGFGLSFASIAETGLFTQLWAMAIFPVAVGALYRCLWCDDSAVALHGVRDVSVFGVVVAVSALVLTHLLFAIVLGWVALLMALIERRGVFGRLLRLFLVGAVVALVIGPWLWPLIAGLSDVGGSPWRGSREDGFPIGELCSRIAAGDLFDAGRAPWLGALVVLGLLGAIVRWTEDRRGRLAVLGLALGLALWLGRTTWGAAFDRLPLHRELEVVRYIALVHAAGIALAAPALAAIVLLVARIPRLRTAIAALLILGPLAIDRARDLDAVTSSAEDTEALDAIAKALALGADRGRFSGNAALGTESHVYRNHLAARSGRPLLGSNARGYHDTLSTYFALSFDRSAEAAALYNVTDLVVLGTVDPGPPWRRAEQAGPLSLWSSTATSSWFVFVRTPFVLGGSPRALRPFLQAESARMLARGELPELDPAQERRTPPPPGPYLAIESVIVAEGRGPGTYACRVRARGGDERLVLKASWDRGWRARIDDRDVPVLRAGPSFVLVDVPAGEHVVELVYRGPPERRALGLVAALAIILLALSSARFSATFPPLLPDPDGW